MQVNRERVVWCVVHTRDPFTGRLRVLCVAPRRLPPTVTTWRSYLGRDVADLALAAAAVVLFVAAAVLR